MSDVVVTVVESTTTVTVTEQDVAVAVTENTVDVSASTAGVQGASGIGYTGVTSTSTITIGSGLKTFSLVSGYAGAFITGMRIRAIHSDTPTYYLEGTANYVGGGTLIITVDKFNGSGSHNNWLFAVAGEIGATGSTGATGASGVIAVSSPITNAGSASSAVVGIDQTLLSLTQSQVTNLTSDLGNTAKLNVDNTFTNNTNTLIAGAGATKLIVKQGATQASVNLQEWVDSGGTVLSQITTGGQFVSPQRMTIGLTALSTSAQLVVASPVDRITMAVRAVSGQTVNMQEWQNSGGTALARISPSGQISTGGNLAVGSNSITATNQFQVTATSATQLGAVIRGVASQSANLQEWQNSGGTAIASISSAGAFRATQTSTLTDYATMREENSGGFLRLTKQTAIGATVAANQAKIYIRDGTTAGTLKLVVRAGAAGAETTILDNIPQ
jgi:hypothetical protein